MSIFDNLRIYEPKWEVVESRKFSTEEVSTIDSAVVTMGQYSLSVCFTLKGGGRTYIPLASASTLSAGDVVDIKTANILTLKRGEDSIFRIIE